MTRPIYEPTLQRTDARLNYGQDQLFRRPSQRVPGVAIYEIKVFEDVNAVTTGDDKFVWEIPEDLDLSTLLKVEAYISTAGADTLELQIRLSDPCDVGADVLSTPVTIDAGECNSKDAAVQPVVTPNTDLAWGDHLHIDVDLDGDGAKGLGVIVTIASSALASVVLAGAVGPQGAPGGIVNWLGEWDSVTNYVINDAISHNGSSYVALANNINVEPGVDAGWETSWMILAEAGTASGVFDAYAVIQDEKSSGTDGGTFTNGAWRTRTLNTVQTDVDSILSLASNQFTLQAGSYFIDASAPAYTVREHRAKLFNVTDSTDDLLGTSEHSFNSNSTPSRARGRITIASAKVFEIQHQCTDTVSTNGFGVAAGFGIAEIYTVVEIWREV